MTKKLPITWALRPTSTYATPTLDLWQTRSPRAWADEVQSQGQRWVRITPETYPWAREQLRRAIALADRQKITKRALQAIQSGWDALRAIAEADWGAASLQSALVAYERAGPQARFRPFLAVARPGTIEGILRVPDRAEDWPPGWQDDVAQIYLDGDLSKNHSQSKNYAVFETVRRTFPRLDIRSLAPGQPLDRLASDPAVRYCLPISVEDRALVDAIAPTLRALGWSESAIYLHRHDDARMIRRSLLASIAAPPGRPPHVAGFADPSAHSVRILLTEGATILFARPEEAPSCPSIAAGQSAPQPQPQITPRQVSRPQPPRALPPTPTAPPPQDRDGTPLDLFRAG